MKLDGPLDEDIDYAAVEAGDTAEDDAEDEAERDADQADGERDAGAVDDAGEHVAAELIGAEQKYDGEGRGIRTYRGGGVENWVADAEEMAAVWPEAPELVGIAFDPEADRVAHGFVDLELHAQGIGIAGLGEAVDEGCALELAVMEEVNWLRRRVGEGDLVGFGVVGGEHLGEDGDHVEEDNDYGANDGHFVFEKAPPHHLQRRSDVDALFLFLDGEVGVGVVRPLLEVAGLYRAGGRLLCGHVSLPSGCGDRAKPALYRRSGCRQSSMC